MGAPRDTFRTAPENKIVKFLINHPNFPVRKFLKKKNNDNNHLGRRVAFPHGHGPVLQRLVVDRDGKGHADLVRPRVAFADRRARGVDEGREARARQGVRYAAGDDVQLLSLQ